jgi:FkbH-like protein
MTEMYWLPSFPNVRERIRALASSAAMNWTEVMALSRTRLDFILINALDVLVRRFFPSQPQQLPAKPVRLALLGSSTLSHLHGPLRIAGLRHNLWVEIYECDYGQYLQELEDTSSALYTFRPTDVLFALDAYHLSSSVSASQTAGSVNALLLEGASQIEHLWRKARESFGCNVIHQTALPVRFPNIGQNEHRLAGSQAYFLQRLNQHLRTIAERENVNLLSMDYRVAEDGLEAWHDRVLWHRSKQEVSPVAAPLYGDLVVRVIAAKRGHSAKCLVLDLDNTLWGGVVGDDGVEGIVLGQGSSLGEAYVAFQQYVRELARRGVIVAVCSKNSEVTALDAFSNHPEMVLKRDDIASFAANWLDKPHNIRAIAEELNIGLDSMVFVDDSPFERELMRREAPGVSVPEMPDEPANYALTLADAGYFESVSVTDADLDRSTQYQSNRSREAARKSATDLTSYLRSLEMRLLYRRFDRLGLQRIVQLINKSNQFNLTTRRYSEEDVLAVIADESAFGLQLRLEDRFGDNGVIAIVIGRRQGDSDVHLDTWLMSCRVLGRQVENATLNIIAEQAANLGARRIIGEYIPSKKNTMVRSHYSNLGFREILTDVDGRTLNVLGLSTFVPTETFIQVQIG